MRAVLFNVLSIGFIFLLTIACQKDKSSDSIQGKIKEPTSFEMYQKSEMAILMNQMYAKAYYLKAALEQGDQDFGPVPENHIKLFSAVLTDPSDKDDFFNSQAQQYLELEKAFYTGKGNKEQQFNQMINSCLACHSQKCGGPISRIQKLLIP